MHAGPDTAIGRMRHGERHGERHRHGSVLLIRWMG